jgi:Microtubule associated protein (MAP65/ASE1 family)
MQSFEMEVDTLNVQVHALKNEMVRYHAVHNSANTNDSVPALRANNLALSNQLEESQQEIQLLKLFSSDLAKDNEASNLALVELKEKISVADLAKSHREGVSAPETIFQCIQAIWNELGISTSERTHLLQQIENCLGDTCARMLNEAEQRKAQALEEISNLQKETSSMYEALGLEPAAKTDTSDMNLLQQLDHIRNQQRLVKPTFSVAVARRDSLAAKVSDLCYALGISTEVLDNDLRFLLDDANTVANDVTRLLSTKLSEQFLSSCEAAISKLRLNKTLSLSDNSKLQKDAFLLVTEMNLSEGDVKNLVVQSIKRRMSLMPSWWTNETAEAVTRSVTTDGGVVRSSRLFSQHMTVFHEALAGLANSRRHLSDKLRGLIERAQTTLLKTVDGEFEANEAYTHLHETLFRLPALSKERIHACLAEIEVLITGVDAMTQSEIEALTVVWEALSIAMESRGKFWKEIDEATRELESRPFGPFDDLIRNTAADVEQWVLAAVTDGSKSFMELETRLFRLEAIHEEVEQLRARQDSKSLIISLDSEVRILSAKLNDFEDKKCSKQRLTTKKSTSSTLLKEERFRKQMQAKFTAKLDQLATLLKEWRSVENTTFDQNLLSEDVRVLLKNSDRSEFMHLRTVEYKSSAKRDAGSLRPIDESNSPPSKRQALASRDASRDLVPREYRPNPHAAIEKLMHRTKRSESQSSRPMNPARNSKRVLSPIQNEVGGGGRCASNKNKARSPFEQMQPSFDVKKPKQDKQRMTLDPFGSVLAQAFEPHVRSENEHPAESDA